MINFVRFDHDTPTPTRGQDFLEYVAERFSDRMSDENKRPKEFRKSSREVYSQIRYVWRWHRPPKDAHKGIYCFINTRDTIETDVIPSDVYMKVWDESFTSLEALISKDPEKKAYEIIMEKNDKLTHAYHYSINQVRRLWVHRRLIHDWERVDLSKINSLDLSNIYEAYIELK